MIWIVSGQISAVRFVEHLLPDWMRKSRMHIVFLVLNFCLGLTSFVAAIGGYIIVIKMILDFGVCVKV
jgi:hypothetical protein